MYENTREVGEAGLMRVQDVAELLSLSRTKVYELLAAGELPSVRVGRARRVPRAAVARFVESRLEGPYGWTGGRRND